LIAVSPLWVAGLARRWAQGGLVRGGEKFATSGGVVRRVADDPRLRAAQAVRIYSAAPTAERRLQRARWRCGQVLFTFWLRAENLPPLTPGFMLTSWPTTITRPVGLPPRNPRPCQPGRGTPVTLALDVPLTAETYGPEDSPVGRSQTSRRSCIWTTEISVPVLDAPRVLRSRPRRFAIGPGERDGAHLPGQPHGRIV
jgi:hypothetical protein